MNLAETTLIVVDVQNGFVRSRSRHVVPAVVSLVRAWHRTCSPPWGEARS